jgi:membrane protein DedA with SNARE-associated domain
VSITDYLLSALGIYGVPVLFAALLIGSIGVPMPASLLLLAAGSFVAQDELGLWPVLGMAAAGAILGDNIGYVLGRWGGRSMVVRLSRFVGGPDLLDQAEASLKRWEGAGIFFSRWLLTPLGPFVNIVSGLRRYSWPRFAVYCVTGEALWVGLYVMLGRSFSDRVQAMSEFFGAFTWVIVGLLVLAVLGWKLLQHMRSPPPEKY